MTEAKRKGPLQAHLDEIEDHCNQGEITLQTIFRIFGNDGHYVIILFLVLPFLQPLPLFGLSTLFGLLIAFVAYLSFVQRPPTIPKRWIHKKLPGSTVLKIAEVSERIFQKIAFILHPRWKGFFKGPFRMTNSALLILNAVLLALPLPIPFSNALPAYVIFFQALGHLEDDGLFIILSYIQTVLCLAYFGFLIFGVNSGLEILKTKTFL